MPRSGERLTAESPRAARPGAAAAAAAGSGTLAPTLLKAALREGTPPRPACGVDWPECLPKSLTVGELASEDARV